jgi:indolepyruvate ferredoxin oxidoreductase beta subunit
MPQATVLSSASHPTVQPAQLAILVAALGGEGGAVLMNWIVAAARASGLAVQATSVPGVAQRTGSTSYYIEMARRPAPDAAAPVFALMPVPGRVDIVVASELVEAARLMERGFLSPSRTTLVTSTSRTYTTAEKAAMADGRYDGSRIMTAAEALACRVVALDLEHLARASGTMISATLFGALSGAGVLPFDRGACEAVLGSGRGAAATRAGFSAAYAAVVAPAEKVDVGPGAVSAPVLDPRTAALPMALRAVASLGVARLVEYQDESYAKLYLTRLATLVQSAGRGGLEIDHALAEAARRLALWMAYEDIPRVAALKTRPERFAQIRTDAEISDDQILHVTEHMKPGVDEIAAMLPAALGRRVLAWAARGWPLPFVGGDLKIRSTGLFGHTLLRTLARGRRWRSRSLRYADEQAAIERWLAAMRQVLPKAPGFAGALAELPRLLKGYGDTLARGRTNYERIMTDIVGRALAHGDPDTHVALIRRAIGAAMTDPNGRALTSLLHAEAARERLPPSREL